MSTDLSGKTIVVTGASTGIGRALALQLAAAGATVVGTARSVDKLETLAAEGGERVFGLVTDVSDGRSVERLAEWALTRFAVIDAVVNNAGIGHLERFLATHVEQWRETLETNLFGALRTMQAFLPSMLERKRGLIINIGSNGSSGWPYLTLYAASKAALETASMSIDREYADRGVRVLCVDVGPTRGTEFGANFTDQEVLAEAAGAWTRLEIPWNDFSTAETTAERILDVIAQHVNGNGES